MLKKKHPTYHSELPLFWTISVFERNTQPDDVPCKVSSHRTMDWPYWLLEESCIHCSDAEYNPRCHWYHRLCHPKHYFVKYLHETGRLPLLWNHWCFPRIIENRQGFPSHQQLYGFWCLAHHGNVLQLLLRPLFTAIGTLMRLNGSGIYTEVFHVSIGW